MMHIKKIFFLPLLLFLRGNSVKGASFPALLYPFTAARSVHLSHIGSTDMTQLFVGFARLDVTRIGHKRYIEKSDKGEQGISDIKKVPDGKIACEWFRYRRIQFAAIIQNLRLHGPAPCILRNLYIILRMIRI
jgi:hypothetical protein